MSLSYLPHSISSLRSRICGYLSMRYLQREADRRGWCLSPSEVQALRHRTDVVLVDLRCEHERNLCPTVPGAVHVPMESLAEALAPCGLLARLVEDSGKCLVFFCAAGGRSAKAVHAARSSGLDNCFHMRGGIHDWNRIHDLPAAA